MIDHLLAPIPQGPAAGMDLQGSEGWAALRIHRRASDWKELRKLCADVLKTKSKDMLAALWWTEANTRIEGFRGLAEGIDLVGGLWSRFGEKGLRLELIGDDPLTFIANSFERFLLQARLTESGDTFTTVINARFDGELHERLMREVAQRRVFPQLNSDLETVEEALRAFRGTLLQQGGRAPDAFRSLRKSLVDLKQTVTEWLAPRPPSADASGSATTPAVPAAAGYTIHVSIEGVIGESAAAGHEGWIASTAYRQTLRSSGGGAESDAAFEIDKYLDRASPALFHAFHSKRVFGRVLVDLCHATDRAERFLRIELRDAWITEVRQSACGSSNEPRPIESIAFRYRRISWTYTKLHEVDRFPEGNTSAAWTSAGGSA